MVVYKEWKQDLTGMGLGKMNYTVGLYLAHSGGCTECAKYRPSSFYPVPFQSNLVYMLFTPPLSFNPICHQLFCIENVYIYLYAIQSEKIYILLQTISFGVLIICMT